MGQQYTNSRCEPEPGNSPRWAGQPCEMVFVGLGIQVAIQTGRKGQGKRKLPAEAAPKENPQHGPDSSVQPAAPHMSPPRLADRTAGHNVLASHAAPCDRQGAGSPGVSRPAIAPSAPVSPATSEAWTLLPGYISRPNPSPIKPKKRPPPEPGGFLRPGEVDARSGKADALAGEVHVLSAEADGRPAAPATSAPDRTARASSAAPNAADPSGGDTPHGNGTGVGPNSNGREYGFDVRAGSRRDQANGGEGRAGQREGLADSVWQSLAQELAGAPVTRPDVDLPVMDRDADLPDVGLEGDAPLTKWQSVFPYDTP
jgi:hypothetical protein